MFTLAGFVAARGKEKEYVQFLATARLKKVGLTTNQLRSRISATTVRTNFTLLMERMV